MLGRFKCVQIFLNKWGSKSRRNSCQRIQPPDNIGNYDLQFLLPSGWLPVFQNLEYYATEKEKLPGVLTIQQMNH